MTEIQELVDIHSLMSFQITLLFEGNEIAIGTGFFYDWKDKRYLVTNWHNLTGREPLTYIAKHSKLALPDGIRLKFPVMENVGGTNRMCWYTNTFRIYEDEEMLKPLWLEHPTERDGVDVVAIQMPKVAPNLPEHFKAVPIDRGRPDLHMAMGSDVFVLGFPRGLSGNGFPIWKRGSIASEVYQKGYSYYIDTATKEGMSGAPVLLRATGACATEGGQRFVSTNISQRFAGIYSGRVGVKDLEAQLGVVWKESALIEIIEGGTYGISSLNLTPKAKT